MAKRKPKAKEFQPLWDRSKGRSVADRFWEKVRVAGIDDCWVWSANTTGKCPYFYGRFWDGKRVRKAHQVAWELDNNKPFPKKKICCHSCDNPLCCNPKHVFPGTFKSNSEDMVQKGRVAHNRGEMCGQSKLTITQVKEIKHLYKTTSFSQAKLGRMFGVSQTQVSRIVQGKRWSYVNG